MPTRLPDREWIERALRHEETGAVPYNFMFSPSAARKLEGHYGTDLEERLAFPIRMTGPGSPKPLYADPKKFGPTVRDQFGVVWSTNEIDRGSPIGPCLPEPTLAGYPFPDPAEESRFTEIGAWCAQQAGHYRVIWVADLWERATFMRGMESLLLDVALEPAFVQELLERLTDYAVATTEILLARYEFEGIAVSDDYGTQQAMIISPGDWRRLIKPCLARLYGLAKKHGRTVFHHSCGHITPIIGEMIDIGLDILHPIQPETMDILELKRDVGRRVTFCGGVSTQDLLVRGTPAAVRAEVRRLQRELGRGGGYILEPGITLQADVPLENMVALIDAARTSP